MSAGDGLTGAAFELWTDSSPSGELAVVSIRGWEQISKPFCFEITLHGKESAHSTTEHDLLGQRCCLFLRYGETCRTVHGILRRVEEEGVSGGAFDKHVYRAWLVPRLWTLGRNKNTRIFQDKTVSEMVEHVLGESNVALRWNLVRRLTPRGYCVQYDESDLTFVERLLAEEGIFYFFEHPDEADHPEVMVLSDSADLHAPIDGDSTLHFRDSGGMAEEEGDVRRFFFAHRVRPRSKLLKEFDFLRPSLDLRASAPLGEGIDIVGAIGSAVSGALSSLSQLVPEVPGALSDLSELLPNIPVAGLPSRADTPFLRQYDHHGEFEGVGVDSSTAARHLEQHRRRSVLVTGETRCRRLLPGRWVEIQGAALPHHDGRYVVVRVEHEGHNPEAGGRGSGVGSSVEIYKNRFHAVPLGTAFRPKRPLRKLQQVLETAIVVGPLGHEIHTDALGRIKVQFHWDRHGRNNEHSSCWIRVMQAWAGAGWGFQFIPRIGMEVMVTFVGGDEDRPMVLGSVYNAEHPPPFPLPQNKQRSGIRSRSTKGGDGFHEISFTDRKGYEELLIRAQRDMKEDILNDKRVHVGGTSVREIERDEVARVEGNQADLVSGSSLMSIGGSRRAAVTGDEETRVEGSRSVSVGHASSTAVQGDRTVRVEGNSNIRVHVNERVRVDGAREHTVRGGNRLEVGGDSTFAVEGAASGRVGRAASLTSRSLLIATGDGSSEHRATLEASAGDIRLRGAGTIILQADEAVELRVGKKKVRIDEDGIHLLAEATEIKGDSFVVETASAEIACDEVIVQGGQAEVELKDTAKVKGTSVALGGTASAPSRDSASSSSARPKTVKIDLFDREGRRIQNAPYRATTAGLRREGTASGGVVELAVPEEAESVELEWGRPAGERPPGANRAEYEFRSEIFLAVDHEDPAEALRRKLHNLGVRGRSTEGMQETFRQWKGLDRAAESGDVDQHFDGGSPVLAGRQS